MRTRAVGKQKEAGENPYPHKFHVQMSLEEFIERYDHIADGDILDEEITVAGKVVFRWIKIRTRHLKRTHFLFLLFVIFVYKELNCIQVIFANPCNCFQKSL